MQPQAQSAKENGLLSGSERGVEHILHSKMRIKEILGNGRAKLVVLFTDIEHTLHGPARSQLATL